ncbi:response regulator transcription factor [Marinibactrum halimedae]|uniref:DNA-binding response regulator n=1 Tax=Marinibactrum halimedae TaxID=1444977 RepID=A0AA37T6W0_9GAMM|nr:response regulator transcription factor [Marinibactrum halimedae]MCD9458967.1 response regulator transcription factor [Marinibactrum halimedae]GLS26904.1 DNA-binding response regulator [Marinibactrum halimedae]
MRILVVEDEQQLREQLVSYLSTIGYVIDAAPDGREGLYLGQEYPYDLAVIDIGLPHINGIDLIKQLRQEGKKFPVLILTARGNWQDKVEGLEAGADDYLVKPFHNEELRARVNALIRRAAGHASPQINFGPLLLDTAAKTVRRNNQLLELTSYEYNTFEYLAQHAGKVVSKTELTEHLYDQDFDRDSNTIEVFVGRLRKKIDPEGDLKPISTIRGQGYRFNLDPQ